MDVTANQEEVSDHEKFQLEFDKKGGCWYIRTMQDKYFTLQPGGGIQAGESIKTPNGMYNLLWQDDGTVCFKAKNGKFVGNKSAGATRLASNKPTYEVINVERPPEAEDG